MYNCTPDWPLMGSLSTAFVAVLSATKYTTEIDGVINQVLLCFPCFAWCSLLCSLKSSGVTVVQLHTVIVFIRSYFPLQFIIGRKLKQWLTTCSISIWFSSVSSASASSIFPAFKSYVSRSYSTGKGPQISKYTKLLLRMPRKSAGAIALEKVIRLPDL